MKLYFLWPSFDAASRDELQPYLDEVATLVAAAMQPTGQEELVGVWDNGEIGMVSEPFEAEHAGKRVRHIKAREQLRSELRRIAAPYSGYFMLVRCLTTCRAVLFGHDGQAFLCLRHEDEAPRATHHVRVDEQSRMLIETDYLDG